MTITVHLNNTVGTYGHDADGHAWTTFRIIGGQHTCSECGAVITQGWTSPKPERYVCVQHVVVKRGEA